MSPVNEPRSMQAFIVLVALLQGLALHLAQLGSEHHWWPFDQLSGCIYWYTLILSVPTVMTLTVQTLRDRRFWQHIAGVTAVYATLASWAVWSATGAPGIQSADVLTPFGFTLGAGLFVLLPYLQCRLVHGAWKAPYSELFEHAWQNGLTLVLVLPFVGLCWSVLWLWGQLFWLVRIDFFRELFRERAFIYLATGTMVGLGILVARTQHRPLQIMRQIVFAVFRGLLPLLAFIALLFLLSLPFTGLQPLWETRRATSIIVSLVYLIVLFTNAVFQDCSAQQAPYPRPLWHLVQAGLCTLPVYAAIALYAMALRVQQYGWTSERLFAVLFVLLVSGHALGYAWAALSRAAAPLTRLPRVNVWLSFASLLVIAAINSPLADPHRIAVTSQLARLHDGRSAADALDLSYLRFSAGRRGYQLMQSLRQDPAITARPEVLAAVNREIEKTSRWGGAPTTISLEQARRNIRLAPGTPAPDDAWLASLIAAPRRSGCPWPGSDCLLLDRDMNGDGAAEHLLCSLGRRSFTACTLYAREAGTWVNAGTLSNYSSNRAFTDAIEHGKVQVEPHPLQDLVIDGKRYSFSRAPGD